MQEIPQHDGQAMTVRVRMIDEAGRAQPGEIGFGTRTVRVLAVDDRWYGRDRTWWKVVTDEGRYVLVHDEASDRWDLAAVVADEVTAPQPRPDRDGAPPLH